MNRIPDLLWRHVSSGNDRSVRINEEEDKNLAQSWLSLVRQMKPLDLMLIDVREGNAPICDSVNAA
jgi:hypothetical protein